MRKTAQRQDLPVEDEPGLQQGQVKSLAVECHHRPEIQLGEKLLELPDETLLLGQVAQKKLADPESIVPEIAEADQERNDSHSAREPGRFEVQETRRGQGRAGEG